MARIRSIKPEFWTDRAVARKLSMPARLFYIGLWNFADEHGRVNGDALYLKGQIFPYDDMTADDIDQLIIQLAAAGKVEVYFDGEDPYLFLPNLNKHQRLEPDKVPSRLPAPSAEPPNVPPPSIPPTKPQADASAQIRTDSSEPRADKSAPGADELSLSYVAGSRLQVAGSREHVSPDADPAQPPLLVLVAEPLAPLAERPPDHFAAFWNAYPRHVAKAKAKSIFATKVKNGADPAAIAAAAKSYGDRCHLLKQDPKFIPHPTTWLNRESWDDDLDAAVPLQPTGTNGHQPYRNPTDSSGYHGAI